jgi:hypothetical protein
MIQIYILVKDIDPMTAVMSGRDSLICGDCKHKRTLRENPKTHRMEWVRPCYVNIGKGVMMVWQAYQRGRYARIEDHSYNVFDNRMVRFGAYGDTCHIPQTVFESVCQVAAGWSGYSHQWKQPQYQWLARYVMASCDNHEETMLAASMGWRRFRVTAVNAPINRSEVLCPSSDEAKLARIARGNTQTVDCNSCGLCNGASARKSIFIPVHGPSAAKAILFHVIQ